MPLGGQSTVLRSFPRISVKNQNTRGRYASTGVFLFQDRIQFVHNFIIASIMKRFCWRNGFIFDRRQQWKFPHKALKITQKHENIKN